jgi:HEPN domain-containing protein
MRPDRKSKILWGGGIGYMIESGGTFLDKARESLMGARIELEGGRYSNSANRSYYAVFQAAIHAILAERIRPPGGGDVQRVEQA